MCIYASLFINLLYNKMNPNFPKKRSQNISKFQDKFNKSTDKKQWLH